MPSPFPGMDPYLEHPRFFPALHERLINQISDALQVALPPAYYAEMRARVWIEYSDRLIDPDVNVLRSSRPRPHGSEPPQAIAVTGSPLVIDVPGVEERELFVEIHTVHGDLSLVTSIEVLSPTNKRPGSPGREKYLAKQQELLASRVNLVEIDLLRGGQHTTAIPQGRLHSVSGPFEYHICIRAMDNLEQRLVYPIRLDQPLPSLSVPLLPGDADVPLNLQDLFSRAYDRGPYSRIELYPVSTPEPPLTAEQAAWAEQLLREKGLLPPS
jgi:hypothetical protein